MSSYTSPLTGKTYDIKSLARVADRRLQCLYVCKYGIQPVDIYAGTPDAKGNDVIIMLFQKDKTAKAYDEWVKNNPKNNR